MAKKLCPKALFHHMISVKNGLSKKDAANYNEIVTKWPTLEQHQQFSAVVIAASWTWHKKTGAKAVRAVRCMLDDIVQCERPRRYPPDSDRHMSNEQFDNLYYPSGGIDECVDEPAEALTRLISLFDGAGVLADGYDPRYKLIAHFVNGESNHG